MQVTAPHWETPLAMISWLSVSRNHQHALTTDHQHVLTTLGLIQDKDLINTGNSIVDIRRSYGRLIATMGFAMLVRRLLHIESAPGSHKAALLITGALNYILGRGPDWPIRITRPNVTTQTITRQIVAMKQIAIFFILIFIKGRYTDWL